MKALIVCLTLVFLLLTPTFSDAQQPRGNFPPALFGSVSQGTATNEIISLSISEAIDRALKYNLGALIGEQDTRIARASRLRALSDVLPKVTGNVAETLQQVNLAAFGFGGFPGMPSVVGPFSVFDTRARLSESLIDFKLLHDFRAASEKLTASTYSQQQVHELVVLITTGLYLDAVAGASRVDAVRSQLKTAQAVYERAVNLKDSGVIPGIDVLRAQVQLQAQQQRVV